ncbi:Zn-ribbon domain-containing OB-fold protein [Desulfoscipio gibsoniae]|uniref:Putative nucleic-acid-binding protein containing a Zn-ribbon n=1 Tax=Desulfoscipio gibsoniae DSM 7213 TaxID=767817 RepID=R4KCC3_9FIRM|nr:OB-fold domain-containing protein [Desulfoscipio gibsoniae]AGL00219.1 putative nucleic-acid-binding protein containing a Zn-ribbon [Desulfoscipio gibsoniae DSM 7213]
MEEQVIYHPDFFVVSEGGEKPYLIAFRCKECGKTWFPILPYCPNCWSNEFDKRELRKGKLYTYTIMYTPQKGIKPPLAFGFVDFPEEGVRVGAQIEMDADVEKIKEHIKIGMEMEVRAGVIREDASGKDTISYKFIPVG